MIVLKIPFVAKGSCRGLEEADRYCGCSIDLGGYPGVDCSAHTLGSTDISGAACQKEGDRVTVSNLREGTCGCTSSGPDDCGYDDATGLYGLCVMDSTKIGGLCIVQSPENCGTVGNECNPATGGPLCMSADEPGAGTCTCDGNNNNCIATVIDDAGNLHSVANNCFF